MADENLPTRLQAPPPEPPQDEGLAVLYARFRADMRRSGLVPYECEDTMLGFAFQGPAVNVSDPARVYAATTIPRTQLVTHGLVNGAIRVYPVLTPLVLTA